MKGSLSGQRFGNYVAHRVLGRGGMGTVYLAEHPDIGRQVAIKVLSHKDNEELIQRFLAEAQMVHRIGHPNIVEIFDFGRTESGRLYYVMEYLEGRELGQLMGERKRMEPEEVLPLLEQLCAAMQAAHEAGVVHRDLKPANIFVLGRLGDSDEPPRLKVLDFGVAKLLDQPNVGYRTTPGALIGTPMFGAPEQLKAEQDKISPQTDLYAIGVIVYWMLTGRPPFMADNNAVLMAMHIEDPLPPIANRRPSVPPAAAAVIERCLAKEPRDRPASAKDLATAFRQAVRGLKDGELPLVFEPLIDGKRAARGADDDVAAVDLEVSTLVEGRQVLLGPLRGVVSEPDTKAVGQHARVASPAAETNVGRAETHAGRAEPVRPDGEFATSTTVEVVREDALRMEPPPKDDDERRAAPASKAPAPTPEAAPKSTESGSWAKPDPALRRSGRLEAVRAPQPKPQPKAAGASEAKPSSSSERVRAPKPSWTAAPALPWIIAALVSLAFVVYLALS